MTTRQQRRAQKREDAKYWQTRRSELAQIDRKARLAAKRRQNEIAEQHRKEAEALQDSLMDSVVIASTTSTEEA